jgi:hypothetical protein
MPPVAGPRRRPGRAQEETRLIGGLQPPSPKLPVLLPSSRGLDFRIGSPSFSQWVSCPRPTDSPHSFAIAPKHNKFPYRYPQRRRWWLEEKHRIFLLSSEVDREGSSCVQSCLVSACSPSSSISSFPSCRLPSVVTSDLILTITLIPLSPSA